MIYLDIFESMRMAKYSFDMTLEYQVGKKRFPIKRIRKVPHLIIEYENGDVMVFLSEEQYRRFCLGRTYKIVGEDRIYHSGHPI